MIELNWIEWCVCALAWLFIARFRLYLFCIVFLETIRMRLCVSSSYHEKVIRTRAQVSPSDSLMHSSDHIQQIKIVLFIVCYIRMTFVIFNILFVFFFIFSFFFLSWWWIVNRSNFWVFIEFRCAIHSMVWSRVWRGHCEWYWCSAYGTVEYFDCISISVVHDFYCFQSIQMVWQIIYKHIYTHLEWIFPLIINFQCENGWKIKRHKNPQ